MRAYRARIVPGEPGNSLDEGVTWIVSLKARANEASAGIRSQQVLSDLPNSPQPT
jgi:hypothetical protein